MFMNKMQKYTHNDPKNSFSACSENTQKNTAGNRPARALVKILPRLTGIHFAASQEFVILVQPMVAGPIFWCISRGKQKPIFSVLVAVFSNFHGSLGLW